ncbi:hypothetical protein AMTRI_Chr13g125290 [Amborella trichopoda]
MASPLLSFSLLILLSLSTHGNARLILENSQSAPNITTTEFLEAHNGERDLFKDKGLKPLTWSQNLASDAGKFARFQRDKHGCGLVQSTAEKYGENQCWGSGRPMSPTEAVGSWIKEKAFYSFKNNTCQKEHECGVYTQLIWKSTAEVGCGQAFCKKGAVTLTICYYFPPGNIQGERPF